MKYTLNIILEDKAGEAVGGMKQEIDNQPADISAKDGNLVMSGTDEAAVTLNPLLRSIR